MKRRKDTIAIVIWCFLGYAVLGAFGFAACSILILIPPAVILIETTMRHDVSLVIGLIIVLAFASTLYGNELAVTAFALVIIVLGIIYLRRII